MAWQPQEAELPRRARRTASRSPLPLHLAVGRMRAKVGGGGAVPGLDEAVSTMRVGGRRELYVPAKLGYGPRAHTSSTSCGKKQDS